MSDFLWGLFLVVCLIAFLRHLVKWRQGKRAFWHTSDYDENSDRVVPMIPGVGPMFDRIELEEEERRQ